MVSESPPFWWRQADWRAWALAPFSAIYAKAARHRLETAPRRRIGAPVLCVGNFTVGGAGKTPVAMALAREAQRQNLNPGFLSRGYGGSISAPHLVDPDHDSAKHVGDEPLTLAAAASTVVSPDRLQGAELLISHGCDFIIMDDGFQSAQIHMDYALLVVDSERGLGNGHTIPGGPMRARLVDQMRHADAILKIGDGDAADEVVRQAARAGRPVYQALTRPILDSEISGERFVAFAGIGHPAKFFRSVMEAGGQVVIHRGFPDHHFYSEDEARDLLATAAASNCRLITTAKDHARLRHGGEALRELAARSLVLEIETVFELEVTPRAIVAETLSAWHRRRLQPLG